MTTADPTAEPTTSLARRAAHTPARDWLRGRITGRLDWRGVIARADLPAPISDLITRVVRRSRLWRLEKADLAAELCAHFADGLASGATPDDLSHRFGNPRDAARLIRRATRRKRPWPARAFAHTLHGLGAALLAAALAYALLAWRFFTGEPTIARNFAAEYNATIDAIPEPDRAWDLYVQSFVEMEDPPKAVLPAWPAIAPEHPRYAEALAYLESQQHVIELAHRAAARPHLGAPMSDAPDPRIDAAMRKRNPEHPARPPATANPVLINVVLPELGQMRLLARLLTFDAHVAADAGEPDRAARDIATMIGIAEHAGERPFLISDLVGIAIEALAIQTTAQIVHADPGLFSDEQLRALAHRHAAYMGGRPRVDLAGERWFFEDVLQRVYTDDGHGDGHLTAEGMQQLMMLSGTTSEALGLGPTALGPITSAIVADRAEMTAKYDEFMTQMERNAELPMWQYDKRGNSESEFEMLHANPIQRTRYFPIDILMPALDKASQSAEHLTQRRDGLLTGLALELYKRDHDAYPDTLDALVPDYLPAVPPDRFTGLPLRYALIDAQPTLWSVGVDRDDDGGRRAQNESWRIWSWRSEADARDHATRRPEDFDGDWVLWPILYEPIATADEDDDDEG